MARMQEQQVCLITADVSDVAHSQRSRVYYDSAASRINARTMSMNVIFQIYFYDCSPHYKPDPN